MKLSRWMQLALAAATVAGPAAALADNVHREVREDIQHTERHVEDGVRGTDSTVTSAAEPLRQTVNIDQTYDQPLASGCTYHATVRGTVSPVADNRQHSAELQHLRPNLRVGATVRCPNSTEAHIQERAVRSTGVTREEFEHLLSLNASVERMQNSGRCMYLPDFAFDNANVQMRTVRYLCPTERGGAARGGGPQIREQDRYPGAYGDQGYIRRNK